MNTGTLIVISPIAVQTGLDRAQGYTHLLAAYHPNGYHDHTAYRSQGAAAREANKRARSYSCMGRECQVVRIEQIVDAIAEFAKAAS